MNGKPAATIHIHLRQRAVRQRAVREGAGIDAVVNALLSTVLADEAGKREAVHQALLASGLVKRIARRTEPDTSERRLAEVQGEPVCETILQERH